MGSGGAVADVIREFRRSIARPASGPHGRGGCPPPSGAVQTPGKMSGPCCADGRKAGPCVGPAQYDGTKVGVCVVERRPGWGGS
eukprot:7055555-Alexandrium_andersonii.AAC.1